MEALRPLILLDGNLKADAEEIEPVKSLLIFLLNHYEFLAAGIRNGDIDERLLKDSERGTVVRLFETFERWSKNPPGRRQRWFEWVRGKPNYGSVSL